MNARDTHTNRFRRSIRRSTPSLLALEARLMFDGAAVVDAAAGIAPDHAADTSADHAADASSSAQTVEKSAEVSKAADTSPIAMQVLARGNEAANGGRREIAFVDSAVTNWSTLVNGIHPGVEIVLIDSRADGLSQIAQYLADVRDIDAVHIISHGQEGEIVLGTLHVNAGDLDQCRDDLAVIGQALKPGGDLLLYGCDVAKGEDGMNFIGQLNQITGADVAASTDTTGSASLGGNWVLEASTGAITSMSAISADAQAAYDGELALPGVHTGSNSSGIFLGGNYIELGIRTNTSIGKFGADTNPGGAFTGRSNAAGSAIAGIGMVGDADGFGTGAVLNIDYFMPGSPEEGFYAGYKISGVATTGKNFGSTVTDTSSGSTLSATINGSIGGNLSVSQAISFDVNDLFFKNVVTLTNIGGSTLDNVRFMRSFDPDNTVDKSGSYSTINTVDRSIAAGDGVAVVSAKSSTGDTYYTRSGNKQATILYYSTDARAKGGMGTGGLAPSGVYDSNVYDSASAKGTSGSYDAYISMAVDVGSLASGATATFTYYTSLDNRDINTILSAIASAGAKSFPAISEDPSSNAGSSVNTVFGSDIAVTAVDNSHGQWQYSSDGTTWSNFGSVDPTSARLLDSTYSMRFVPDADWNGGSTITYRVWDGNTFSVGGTADASSAGSNFSVSTADASITVNAVNDAPVFTKGADQTVLEDAGAQTVNGWATGIGKGGGSDEAGQSINFTVTNDNNALFSVQPSIDSSGNLTYTAAANANGSATVTLSLHDNGGTSGGGADTSATQTFTINVTPVNDAPVNDVVPTFSGGARGDGSLRQEGALTANPQTWHDVDVGDPATSFTYQWQIADDAGGTGLRDITGATTANYSVTAADIGKYIRVKVIGSDGVASTPAYSSYKLVSNIDPVASATPLADQTVSESVPFSYSVPAGSFSDANVEDTLHYSATLADGSPLPAWLSFDPTTRTFSGTPSGSDTGLIAVRVIASDHGLNDAHLDFSLRVLGLPVSTPTSGPTVPDSTPPAPGVDSTPVAPSDGTPFIRGDDTQPLSNQSLATGPTDAGVQGAGDRLAGSSPATASSLDAGRNPGGLDAGTPVGGLTRPDGFRVMVEAGASNDISLLLVRPLGDQVSKPAEPIRMSVPADTFVHTQQDAVITLMAARTDGAALPGWLHFDSMKGQFSGNPPDGFEGDLEVKVTARDNFGNEVSTVFRFRVHARAKVSFSGREGLSAQIQAHTRGPVRALPARERALA